MRTRFIFSSALLVLLAIVWLAPAADASEINIGSGGDYATLEAFRLAYEATPSIMNGVTVINLHNDDSSLTQPIFFPADCRLTVRSVGGMHTVTGRGAADVWFAVDVSFVPSDPAPELTIQNIRVTGNDSASPAVVTINSSHDQQAVLNISGSLFENNLEIASGAVNIFNNVDATITNTIFRGNAGYDAGAVTLSNAGTLQSTSLDLVFDAGAPLTTTWSGNNKYSYDANYEREYTPNSIYIQAGPGVDSSITLNVSVAGGRIFDLRDPISGSLGEDSSTVINKLGSGTWKLDGLNFFYRLVDDENAGNLTLNIREGRFHARKDLYWTGLGSQSDVPYQTGGGDINVYSGAVFKPTITAGNMEEIQSNGEWTSFDADNSVFFLDNFHSEEGARLEVGGISSLPHFDYENQSRDVRYGIIAYGDSATVASTMRVENSLMHAWLESDDAGVVSLYIDQVANLSTLKGVGHGVDQYRRREDIPDAHRDWLDDIYNRGYLTGQDRANLQGLNGDIVMLSQLAMRNALAGSIHRLNKRVTSFQNEELGELGIGNASFCDQPTYGNYGELWAYIDKNWMHQKDLGDMAGYKYNPYGLGIGYDYHTDQLIVGGLLQFNDGDIKLSSSGATRTSVQTLVAAAYASWASEGYYLTGGLHAGMGWNRSKTTYVFPGLVQKADTGGYNTRMLGVSAEFGYMAEFGHGADTMRVTPYLGLAYAKTLREAVREKNADDLNRQFRRSEWDLWDLSLGVRVAKPFAYRNMVLTPSADLAFVRTMGSASADGGDAHFIAAPGDLWNIDILKENRNAFRLDAGLNAQIRENLDIGMNYKIEWREKYWASAVDVNMSWGF